MTQQQFIERFNYNLKTDKIGGGSFGTVYKAYDNGRDREVAIKVSEVRHIGNKEFSLLQEYDAIKNLPIHQNIAFYEDIYRFDTMAGTFDYAIMQYYPLGNLSHYLKTNPLTSSEREKLVIGILKGIGFLHQYQVVHRDLKPSNILVVDRQGQLIPKITDFGLSKQANKDNKASQFTNYFAGGTLQYSSPEQVKGLPLKFNTDLWSFGVIAYEILTGNTLFETKDDVTGTAEWQKEITNMILYEDVSIKLKNLSHNWQGVIVNCLERDPEKRVQNIEEVLQRFNTNNSKNIASKKTPISTKKPSVKNDIKHQETAIKTAINDTKTQIKENAATDNKDSKPIISKTSYWSSFFVSPLKMKRARTLCISLIILSFVQIVIMISSLATEEEFNEYQPDYNPDFTLLDIFFMFWVALWLIYGLAFYFFSIRINLKVKILIPVLLLPLMLFFEFLGNMTMAIFMLYIVLSPVYWIVFWLKHRNFKKLTNNS